jgi:phage FluMu protein Com
MKTPPKCPNCGKSLTRVLENDYKTYVFEPRSGTYRLDEVAGYIETHCPHCDADLGDLFEEGACNYTR